MRKEKPPVRRGQEACSVVVLSSAISGDVDDAVMMCSAQNWRNLQQLCGIELTLNSRLSLSFTMFSFVGRERTVPKHLLGL